MSGDEKASLWFQVSKNKLIDLAELAKVGGKHVVYNIGDALELLRHSDLGLFGAIELGMKVGPHLSDDGRAEWRKANEAKSDAREYLERLSPKVVVATDRIACDKIHSWFQANELSWQSINAVKMFDFGANKDIVFGDRTSTSVLDYYDAKLKASELDQDLQSNYLSLRSLFSLQHSSGQHAERVRVKFEGKLTSILEKHEITSLVESSRSRFVQLEQSLSNQPDERSVFDDPLAKQALTNWVSLQKKAVRSVELAATEFAHWAQSEINGQQEAIVTKLQAAKEVLIEMKHFAFIRGDDTELESATNALRHVVSLGAAFGEFAREGAKIFSAMGEQPGKLPGGVGEVAGFLKCFENVFNLWDGAQAAIRLPGQVSRVGEDIMHVLDIGSAAEVLVGLALNPPFALNPWAPYKDYLKNGTKKAFGQLNELRSRMGEPLVELHGWESACWELMPGGNGNPERGKEVFDFMHSMMIADQFSQAPFPSKQMQDYFYKELKHLEAGVGEYVRTGLVFKSDPDVGTLREFLHRNKDAIFELLYGRLPKPAYEAEVWAGRPGGKPLYDYLTSLKFKKGQLGSTNSFSIPEVFHNVFLQERDWLSSFSKSTDPIPLGGLCIADVCILSREVNLKTGEWLKRNLEVIYSSAYGEVSLVKESLNNNNNNNNNNNMVAEKFDPMVLERQRNDVKYAQNRATEIAQKMETAMKVFSQERNAAGLSKADREKLDASEKKWRDVEARVRQEAEEQTKRLRQMEQEQKQAVEREEKARLAAIDEARASATARK